MNGIEDYNKEVLDNKIRKLTIANIQLITNKMETKKVRINLKVDRTRLLDEKNSLVVKKEEFRTEIVILNIIRFSNVPVYSH